jgi:hypothetical protein
MRWCLMVSSTVVAGFSSMVVLLCLLVLSPVVSIAGVLITVCERSEGGVANGPNRVGVAGYIVGVGCPSGSRFVELSFVPWVGIHGST